MIKLNKSFIVALISYFIGNFSSAYILGKAFQKKDIRNYGSGNAGATNALRVFGKKLGGITFILDVLKGIIAVYIGERIMGYNGKLIASIFVVLGHDWPVFLKFKGGKGVATSLGVIFLLHYPTAIICTAIGIAIIIITRYVSLGSIIAAGLVPIVGSIVNRPFNKNFFITTFILAILVISRHKDNINRLVKGEEFKLGEKV
ncbi:glycerol-3-phosphate 1-O-acyltransferase PlsY [Keratinibaculum paraultunense]|uniref:glycerol-3-phosphate 1-O-acyltransferase PlsY n=1 Tax=Keratinibaculum paraultunense TaxID=1278232 RepID=UPI001ED952E7|nr:glycerol-3-phosphate 1-O-acyltransferase PlsY [Keratinibaculum paraultunense]